ncbi:MAG: UDP-N-acetylglucosamine 1-carboxyvinyltransferase [Chloroflexota bacterium]
MGKYVIGGGAHLTGSVRISGAKNAVLPMLAGAVLTRSQCIILDAPDIRDLAVMSNILRSIGVSVEVMEREGRRAVVVSAANLRASEVPEDLMREMRSSIFLMGPLLGRTGKVRVSYPGGCAIGSRPIDLHLNGLRALGATITEKSGYIHAEARQLKGKELHLDFPSVGATENIMMAAVLAKGTTVIHNAAKEPEIVDLQNFLNGMGARITGAGMDVIRIEGVPELGGTEHVAIPDRIEAGTFMAAAAITGSDITLENVIPEHVEAVMAKLRETGAEICGEREHLSVRCPARPKAVDFKTLPYPGFPTDMQPQMMALMCIADGTSVITETVFENRLKQAEELRRMGANIKVEGRTAVVKGVPRLSGARVTATDLRSGAALVLAGLVADEETQVEEIEHIDRGYENFDAKLRGLGVKIHRLG